MADVLIERGNLETDTRTGRTPGEDETRDKGDVSTSQEMPRFPANHQKLGEKHGIDFSSQPVLRRNQLFSHLDLGLLPSRTINQFLLFTLHPIHGTLLQ